MQNRMLIEAFGVSPKFHHILDLEYPAGAEVKTYFSTFRNPIGIEVEVEDAPPYKSPLVHWKVVEDGSLKIRGAEYVSLPLSGKHIDYAIHELSLFLKTRAVLWSHRTSIHCHVNMSSLNEAQLDTFVAIYGLFEGAFYELCDPIRRDNPYCYPALSVDPSEFGRVNEESKYCALNLAPLNKQMTVEFRHMDGNDEWRRIRRWLQLIVKLHAFVDRNPEVLKTLVKYIEAENLYGLFTAVFGATSVIFDKKDVETWAKEGLFWSIAYLDGRIE